MYPHRAPISPTTTTHTTQVLFVLTGDISTRVAYLDDLEDALYNTSSGPSDFSGAVMFSEYSPGYPEALKEATISPPAALERQPQTHVAPPHPLVAGHTDWPLPRALPSLAHTQANHFFAASSLMSQDDYEHIECIKLRMCPFRACRRARRHHLGTTSGAAHHT